MANIKVTAREDFGREFCPALQNIRAKYTYSHSHNDASLKDILQKLAKADSVRTLKDAPAPGTTNAVTTTLKKMRITVPSSMGDYDSSDDFDYTESSLGASGAAKTENDKEEGWTIVTRGCKPKLTQPITIYTNNSFKLLSTNNNPKTNTKQQQTTPVSQPNATKDTKKRR